MAKNNADGYKKAVNTQNCDKRKDNTNKIIGMKENGKQKNICEEKQNRKKINADDKMMNTKKNSSNRVKQNTGENSSNRTKQNTGENSSNRAKQNTKKQNSLIENPNGKNNVQEKPKTQKQGNSKKKNTDEKYSNKNRNSPEVQYDTAKKTTSHKKNPNVNKGMSEEKISVNKPKSTSAKNQKENKKTVRSRADKEFENNTNYKNKDTNTNERINPNFSKEPENTEQPQKHWTQLNREYRLRRQGIYEPEQTRGYREIPRKIDLPLNGCGFGDEHFLFAGPDGSPKYEDINAPWDDFINWMEKVCKGYRKYKDTTRKGEYFIGQELIVHAARRNVHTIYCYISLNWVGFRDGFLLQEDCPETVIEFVRGILANKMTEKQMWGTVDDRCPGGTVIVFDKAFMPKEGEDTGTIKFEYHPNYIQEKMEKMKRSNGML